MSLSVYPETVPAGWLISLFPAGVGIGEMPVLEGRENNGRLISLSSTAAFVDQKGRFQRQKRGVHIKGRTNMSNEKDIRSFATRFSLPSDLPLEKQRLLYLLLIPKSKRLLLNFSCEATK